jgi:hypothetical protein
MVDTNVSVVHTEPTIEKNKQLFLLYILLNITSHSDHFEGLPRSRRNIQISRGIIQLNTVFFLSIFFLFGGHFGLHGEVANSTTFEVTDTYLLVRSMMKKSRYGYIQVRYLIHVMSVSPGAGEKDGGNPDIDQHSSGYRSEARFRTTYKDKCNNTM